MQIPSQFKLAGHTITVVRDPELYAIRRIVGEAQYNTQQIVLDTGSTSLEQQQQNFLHELMHWVFFILNEDTHRNDEKLVDTIAHMLHQAFTTSV